MDNKQRGLMVHKTIYFLTLGLLLVMTGCVASSPKQEGNLPKIDRISEAELARIMPKPVAKLTLDDVVRLSQEGHSPDQVIESIEASHSFYDLTPSQAIALSQQGVDRKVLDYIHTSRELALRNNVADEINKREKEKQLALEKLKRQQLQQQYTYDPFCYGYFGMHRYGYGAYGSRFRPHFGIGVGSMRPWHCW